MRLPDGRRMTPKQNRDTMACGNRSGNYPMAMGGMIRVISESAIDPRFAAPRVPPAGHCPRLSVGSEKIAESVSAGF